MRRRLLIALGVIVALAAGYVGVQFSRFVSVETIKIDDHFYVMLGGGGNTAVLIADDGVLVVDTKFWSAGRRLPSLIKSITDKPVKVIINTHYHSDHTHGNPNYPRGTDVIAQRRTRQHLIELDKSFWESEPAWSLLPGDLVDEERELHFGDETIRIFHPGRGHTDGDVVVYFSKRHILHTGDLFLHNMYPFIDLRGGGSALEWPATLDRVLAVPDVAQYIPGHGPLSTRADVERFQAYLRSLLSQVQGLAGAAKSLSEIQAAVDLHAYDDFTGTPFFTSRDKDIQWVYEELTAKKK
jgi:glyoxylase-like metal-dependent hydrolase (beta-lactamase superfamily II)